MHSTLIPRLMTRYRFFASLAGQTDHTIVAEGVDEHSVSRSIFREKFRFIFVIFAFMCEWAICILLINLITITTTSIVEHQTNEICSFLLYIVLIGLSVRWTIIRDLIFLEKQKYLINICTFFSIIAYLIPFIVSSLYINQTTILLISIPSWIGLFFSILSILSILFYPFSVSVFILILSS